MLATCCCRQPATKIPVVYYTLSCSPTHALSLVGHAFETTSHGVHSTLFAATSSYVFVRRLFVPRTVGSFFIVFVFAMYWASLFCYDFEFPFVHFVCFRCCCATCGICVSYSSRFSHDHLALGTMSLSVCHKRVVGLRQISASTGAQRFDRSHRRTVIVNGTIFVSAAGFYARNRIEQLPIGWVIVALSRHSPTICVEFW